ncbi:ATP-binding sensor histidine kinase [Microcoleus sp. FACHB-672]|uniref:trifunctional serine/threonine-protein kinase/ATP-binding protein/sensor histidine kinase n=1 Tax=Microcoleus sp. FACHB-672 TaxID=2692825 RepID=UPI0016878681|nr:ATP-binding sensor histidine kinase [Microcoleus sp. FACHB-672]MBD2039536.1 AAA family ATPase [Microcoleus sp. FACHB-672]
MTPVAQQLPIISGYTLVEQLYLGSRTAVYRGVQNSQQCPVVIKTLRHDYPSFSELVQFRNQYAIAKNLDIPGIVQPISLEPYANGYALVMEDIGGISLRHYIHASPLTVEQFWPIALQVVDVLHQLYQQRIIHKDIKPANILIQPETGQIKVIDFSIASLLPRETQEIQNPNVLEGTLAYISPEQTGRMNRGIDYRSDFYSLGITFFELLTGQLPFPADEPMEMVHAHLAKQPLSVCDLNPDLPIILGEIIRKLVAKNAEDRYQSALGLKHDLMRCQQEYQGAGKLIWFQLGERDISDRFLIPEKLYGREQEVYTLLDAFGRVANGASELMLVAGFSGIGKTAIVNEVHKPIVRWHGYFIKGKFDQFNRNLPFSAFVQAFRDLMGQLLSSDDAQLQAWKAKILAAVGDNGQVLIEVIPELEQVLGQQPPVPELSGSAAQNRFNLLFQKFITVFTTPEHPLVIFLDDLQWSDSASLNLLKLLLTERDRGYLFIIGAYRDNEVFPTHPLMLMLDEIKKAQTLIHTLTLEPLSQADVNQLTADTLSCSIELAQPLTELVYQKTKGNPFFLTQFLKALHEDGYISFDYQVGHWQCDLATVKLLALTDDVVEFMALQLQKLPVATQTVLKLAACVGAQFDLATLAIIKEQSPEDTAIDLWKALQEGVILPITEVYKFYQPAELKVAEVYQAATFNCSYRFLHDRVQQAAYSLIPDEQKQTTHYQIGQLLLRQVSPAAREERIFEIVNQLNYGTTLVEEQQERDELAQLNLTACHKARSATAYQAAREYAKVGLELLGTDAWHRHYEMALSLYNLAAEVAFLVGDFEQMDQWIKSVIHHAKTPLEQVQVYQVRIQALVARNQFLEAIAIGQSVFQMLGVNLPDETTLEDIRQVKQEIDALIEGRSIESFLHLPAMTDRQQLAIMQNAARLTPVCYMTGSKLYFLVVALQVKLSIQFGNSPVSAYCYAGYAFQLRTLWSDMSKVPQFGQLAYQLASEPDAKNIRAATALLMGGYVGHWTIHLQETLPILLEGYQAGLETGNLEFMGYDAQLYCFNAYWCGQPLAELEPQIRAYYQQLCDLHQVTAANCVLAYWQAAQILLGQSEDEIPLRQDAYEEKVLAEAKVDFYRLSFFYLYRFTLNYWLEDFAKAEHDGAQTRHYLAGGMGSIVEPIFYFYDSLNVLATPPESISESEPRWQRMQENQAKLKDWADYGPMNYLHKYHLVEAQKHQLLNCKTEALEFYDLAIKGAKENGYIQEEALANELAAKFYLEWGKEKIAQTYMQEAYYGYARWGAEAKINDLEKRYPQLLKPILQQQELNFNPLETITTLTRNSVSLSTHTSTSTTSISDALDFASILKAAQAISSSIKLDELITSLTRILLETSGAKKAVLILPEKNTWQVRAITSIHLDSNSSAYIQTILESQPVELCQDIPKKIIYYVKNTQQKIFIDNLQTDIPGVMGEYMLTYQPQSVFCLPILNQKNLVGILYLENQLTRGVFTKERLKVINLLASQVAISLENARLYQEAQQALQDLQQAQLQIVQSEKMSALGNLVAGVAHEINNPVGFIAGNLDPAQDYIQDLFRLIDLYQKKLPNPDTELADEIEAIDIEYLQEDLPKLIDSMKLGVERIRNISTSLRTFSRADKDYKVPFNIHEGIDSTILILKHRLKANDDRPAIKVVTEYGNLSAVECFPGQLNQVFMNLLANAIDALEDSNQGHSFKEIQASPNCITIRTEMKDNEWVMINIADNGSGMTEAVKQRIFDHLFTTKAVGQGTGLGLAIARQIVVEKHGGRLEVQSELGQGTEFSIFLPVRS